MKLIYQSKHHEISDIWTFVFIPMDELSWQAGQSLRIELPAGYGVEERRFSIASAPFEESIRITTRLSDSDFKQALNNLEPGQTVDAFSIGGDFAWGDSQKHRVLCAGGIGITAFIPILKQHQHDHTSIDATLFYSFKNDSFLFEDTLASITALHPNFSVELLPNKRITAELIRSRVTDFRKVPYLLSGPSAFVDQLSTDLIALGVSDGSITRDWFTGKSGWDTTAVSD